jgi:nitrite reductase (NO-forming)
VSAPPRTARASWHLKANAVVVAYLAVTAVAAIVHATGHASLWLVVHLFLLGTVTNAIVIWTPHFTATLLQAPASAPHTASRRLVALNLGILGVLVGVTTGNSVLTVTGAALVAAVIATHIRMLVRTAGVRRNSRFANAVRFYWVAAVALVVGITAGVALTFHLSPDWHSRLYSSHVHLNLFGWVALTVLGTEFTLWPMVLHTRIVDGVERAARRALLLCTAGLALTVAGLLAAARPLTATGLAVYTAGVCCCLDPFVRTARQRLPRSPAAWMLAAGAGWLAVGVALDLAAVLGSGDPIELAHHIEDAVPWVLAGFAAQTLLGALTYLLPVVLGGSPVGGRRVAAVLDRLGTTRAIALNLGVVLLALPLPAFAVTVGWTLVAAAFTSFVALAAVAVTGAATDSRRRKRHRLPTQDQESAQQQPRRSP